jgi:hypothetical protein
MVCAILEGIKTQTRRTVKPQPPEHWLAPDTVAFQVSNGWALGRNDRYFPRSLGGTILHCPYGEPGYQLWGRETWAAPHDCDHLKPREIPKGTHIHYAATEERGGLLWRPSIFMPRWASRITMEITGVRLERLHEISEADCWAEGIASVDGIFDHQLPAMANRLGFMLEDPRVPYACLWESINGAGSWDERWIWAIAFSMIQPTPSLSV